MRLTAPALFLLADLLGVGVFAVEGALSAIQAGLDLMGVLVLAFVVALGGGVVRDLLIGAPPAALRDWRYTMLAFACGAATFLLFPLISALPPQLLLGLDAAGLALFAVAGTGKALDHAIAPVIAPMLGTITGVGGGAVRDVLLNQVPRVLHSDIYASAALAAGVVLVAGRGLRLPTLPTAICAGLLCFGLRLAAVAQGWQLPRLG